MSGEISSNTISIAVDLSCRVEAWLSIEYFTYGYIEAEVAT